jgi:hypothetical protein
VTGGGPAAALLVTARLVEPGFGVAANAGGEFFGGLVRVVAGCCGVGRMG